ncbi:MAG: 1-deoxy-D-xylulose-5-phosphate synthase [Planctomycetota bacterium]|nr:MAG: 1-deoxy-D-xylulose-5-phosphate synthase [Planctomycetota bacterium]
MTTAHRLADLTSPADLKALSVEDLNHLCGEMRTALIEKVRKTGGHLGSNLGVVELTVAMHKVFDFRQDKLVFDVSHQCYPHKMLTGRYDRMETIRRTGGLSGFCNRFESPYDVLTAGHAGTAISFALGVAEGMKAKAHPGQEVPWTLALVGDAGLGAGVAFEGLTEAAERRPQMIVVLNDNEWSIAQSVGALARYFSRIRSSRTMQVAYERLKDLGGKLPWVGQKMNDLGEVLRHVLIPGHIFEELGVNYVGPLDGHDMGTCLDAFQRLKRMDGVHLVHFLTEKGRGYEPAKSDPQRAHGVSPPKADETEPEGRVEVRSRRSYTGIFGDEMLKLAEEDHRVVAITAAMRHGTGLLEFSEKYPQRFYDTGITEQHAVALAGGLATSGIKPVAAIYSTFLQRGYDQVFQEVALQQEDVILALDRGGLVGQDGPTHQGLYDLAYLRALPGIHLASPRDAVDLGRMLRAALAKGGPWAFRWPRGEAMECLGPEAELRPELVPGTAEKLRSGTDGAVLALGALVEPAWEAVERLAIECGIELELWDARFARPLDLGAIADIARRHAWIAAVEEHSLNGGFSSSVAEALADLDSQVRLSRHGVVDRYIPHASTREEQLRACCLDADSLFQAWRAALEPSPQPFADPV